MADWHLPQLPVTPGRLGPCDLIFSAPILCVLCVSALKASARSPEPDELHRDRVPAAAASAAAHSAFRVRDRRRGGGVRARTCRRARACWMRARARGSTAHHFARQRYCGVDLAVGDAAWDYSRIDALADLTALPFRDGQLRRRDPHRHHRASEASRAARWRRSRARWRRAARC